MIENYLSSTLTWWAHALTWLHYHGEDMIYAVMCASPVVLAAMFVWARIREALWQDNPINIAQYPTRGISFTPRMTTQERLQAALALIVIAVVVLIVILPALA